MRVRFRRRFAWTLAMAAGRNFGWLLAKTRGLTRLETLLPPSTSPEFEPPSRRTLLTISVGTCAGGAVIEALRWALTRPLLPRQPELARLVLEQTTRAVTVLSIRKISGALGMPQPRLRLAVLPPPGPAVRVAVDVLAYGALERLLARRARR
jgi:hypothetical protein